MAPRYSYRSWRRCLERLKITAMADNHGNLFLLSYFPCILVCVGVVYLLKSCRPMDNEGYMH